MKTLKVSLLALLFTVGIGGAVVQNIQAATKKLPANYHWLKYAANGVTRVPAQDMDATISAAESAYGCAGTGNRCADGEKIDSGDGPDNLTIKFN